MTHQRREMRLVTMRGHNPLPGELLALPPRWVEDALCGEVDPETFHPKRGDDVEPAKRICAQCPVRLPCLAYGLEHEAESYRYGIFGGLTPQERRALTKQQRQNGKSA